jgi:hypothetical protein
MAEMKNQDEIALDPIAGTANGWPDNSGFRKGYEEQKSKLRALAAITDTQMLDWMEANGITPSRGRDGRRWLTKDEGQDVQLGDYPTIRAAITAAMTGADPCL